MSEVVEEDREGSKQVHLGPKVLEIPETWDFRRLSDVTEINPNYDRPDRETFDFVPMDAVDEEKRVIKYWTERSAEDCTTTWFKNGDTIYAKITPCAENGKIAFVEGVETDVASGSTEFVVLSPADGVLDPKFTFYLANLPQFRSVTISLMEGSTARQRIPTNAFKAVRVPVPPLPEQRRIADILSTVDEQIQQKDEIIEKSEELKRGLMQDIFNIDTVGESSNPQFGISLKKVQEESLGDHVTVVSGVHVESNKVSDDDTKTPYLTGPDDFDQFGFSVTKYTDDPPKFCEPGDTLVTVKGSGCGKTTFANKRASISRQLKALRASESLDEYYLYYWMETKQELLSILAQGTSIPGLSTSDLTTLRIPIPPIEKQTQIGDLLSNLDLKIQQEERHKENLQELKRGLMQDLLTGKVRVDDLDRPDE